MAFDYAELNRVTRKFCADQIYRDLTREGALTRHLLRDAPLVPNYKIVLSRLGFYEARRRIRNAAAALRGADVEAI